MDDHKPSIPSTLASQKKGDVAQWSSPLVLTNPGDRNLMWLPTLSESRPKYDEYPTTLNKLVHREVVRTNSYKFISCQLLATTFRWSKVGGEYPSTSPMLSSPQPPADLRLQAPRLKRPPPLPQRPSPLRPPQQQPPQFRRMGSYAAAPTGGLVSKLSRYWTWWWGQWFKCLVPVDIDSLIKAGQDRIGEQSDAQISDISTAAGVHVLATCRPFVRCAC